MGVSDFPALNQGFVVNDDNRLPYLKLPIPSRDDEGHQIRRTPADADTHPAKDLRDVTAFIVPLASRIVLPAEDFCAALARLMLAEVPAVAYNATDWEKQMKPFRLDSASTALVGKGLTLRPFLTSCRNFKDELSRLGMGHSLVRDLYREMPLPHFIWVCEIRIAEEYGPDRNCCRGEILWDATVSRTERMGFLAVHYPDFFAYNRAATWENRPVTGPHDIWVHEATDLPPRDFQPYPLSRSNLDTL